MPLITTNNAITWGYASSYLAAVQAATQNAFSNGTVSNRIQNQILFATQTINWIYAENPYDSNLPQCVNYLVSLCGTYLAQAQQITTGGSSVIINPATGSQSSIASVNMQFIIGDAGCPIDPNTGGSIVAGGTQFIVPYTYILSQSLQIIYNGQPLYNDLSDEITFTALYTDGNAIVTLNQGVQDGDKIKVNGLQYITI